MRVEAGLRPERGGRRDLRSARPAATGDRARGRTRARPHAARDPRPTEQRLPLLTGGARDLPTRQQTLEAAIAWSYELLEPGQQRLFAELGAFNGGRAFAAIEAVCNPAGELDVLTAVEALCDGSLLNQQEDADGEVRFVMLETIHEYARARLADLPDADVVSERHALYFHALAVEGGGHKLQSSEGGIWRKRFEAEIDNLRLALDWLEAAGASELELAMGARLSNFWRGWGLIKEGRARLEGMLARASSEPSVVLCRALVALASLYDHLGEREESLEMDRRALAVAEETGDDELVAFVLNNLGLCLLTLGDHETGTAKLEECAAIGRRIGDRDITLNALGNLAWDAITVGNWEDARSRCTEVIDLARDAGADYGLAGATVTSAGRSSISASPKPSPSSLPASSSRATTGPARPESV